MTKVIPSRPSIFDCSDYKQYLNSLIQTSGVQRGLRARLARKLKCQPAYVSQVLNGSTHFTPEHAVAISEFFGHSQVESRYFLLLILWERAGTQALRRHYQEQIKEMQSVHKGVKDRLKISNALDDKWQQTYYSSWLYAAIHIMTSVPRFQSIQAIASHLHFPVEIVHQCLNFLVESGLVHVEADRYKISSTRIHLGPDSPHHGRHHINWRMKAIQALEFSHDADLHYSAVISLSEADYAKVKAILLEALQQKELILKTSKDEAVFCLGLDFFRI